ncbi:cytochrome c [Vibrio sp. ABG19]|uniref:c-type cytochrome n=1 Tax=Vibrio sp. ABG19 TaxID=2817385 RepID=UPI00249F7FC0|nr:cytochrome c [Vibrio sp. ABG19]WGY45524.1 cytochrome c [Vibrio sp. ABG19]
MMKKLFACLLLGGLSAAAMGQTPESDLVARGEYLARAGDCVACHTAQGGAPFAGGLSMPTPIGNIYSTNITPDKETGIGGYSFEDFDQAVRHGVRKDGDSLYPAMPYPSYAIVSKQDMRALYAYFMQGVKPVKQANHAVDIPWPLSMRWPLSLWRGMFAPGVQDFSADSYADVATERGRYLVQGLGHCGACHTPRAITMQEKALSDGEGADYLSGGDPMEGWVAKNLRGDNKDGLGQWSEQELVTFLKTGRNSHTAVFGGMTDVVEHSLQYLSQEDLTAIARYLKSLPAKDPQQASFKPDGSVANALWHGDDSKPGAAVYIDSCAACHKSDGSGYDHFFPALRGNSVVQTEDATSLIHVVLAGSTLPGTQQAPSAITMPPFGWRLSDQEVAEVVNFIRSSWGNQAKAVDAAQVKAIRAEIEGANPALLGNVNPDKLSQVQR